MSSASSRSKYLAASKLTKSNLFQAIRAKKNSDTRGILEEKCLEVQLLQDTLTITERKEDELLTAMRSEFRSHRDDARKLMRALEHLTQ